MKYRWFYTSRNKLVLAGKNAQQNEQLVKKAEKKAIILHTKAPGSPFCILKGKITAQDIREAAIFCACFSQGWKKKKKEMEVHVFKGEQILKEKRQKAGTFSVLGRVQKARIKLQLGIKIQKKKIRAVPIIQKTRYLIFLRPGKIPKEKTAGKIKEILEKKRYKFTREEILQAIPSGGFLIKEIKK
ncbi:MAG: DUF814 domain-containing protein [Candidatus Pacearchaeota archaeon]|nr:MAG: DUF814 domain-containing protein [Candidatus Pacearchaeota archaeon]